MSGQIRMWICPRETRTFKADDGFFETLTVGKIWAEFNPYTDSGRGVDLRPGLRVR